MNTVYHEEAVIVSNLFVIIIMFEVVSNNQNQIGILLIQFQN